MKGTMSRPQRSRLGEGGGLDSGMLLRAPCLRSARVVILFTELFPGNYYLQKIKTLKLYSASSFPQQKVGMFLRERCESGFRMPSQGLSSTALTKELDKTLFQNKPGHTAYNKCLLKCPM